MSIESRLRRLEKQDEGLYRTLTLPDVQQIRYTDEDVRGALAAAIRRQEHRLLPPVRQLDTTEGVPSMIRLVRVLMETRDRIKTRRLRVKT